MTSIKELKKSYHELWDERPLTPAEVNRGNLMSMQKVYRTEAEKVEKSLKKLFIDSIFDKLNLKRFH